MYSIIADIIVVVHFLFIVFVVGGGLLVLRWPRLAWIHLPAVFWGVLVELQSWICPLTPLENHFRDLAGKQLYGGDFVERYLLPVIYPATLTASIQQMLGGAVIVINVIFYAWIIKKHTAIKS